MVNLPIPVAGKSVRVESRVTQVSVQTWKDEVLERLYSDGTTACVYDKDVGRL